MFYFIIAFRFCAASWDGKLPLGACEGLVIGAFANDANVFLRAVSGQTIVPGPFVANLVTRNRWFRWGSNRFAIIWRFSRLTWSDLRQQGRGGQKLDLEMIKGVPPLNQTKFEGTQHLVMKGADR